MPLDRGNDLGKMNGVPVGERTEQQIRLQEAFWAGQTEVLELILSGLPLEQVLEKIAVRIEKFSEVESMCSIFLANPEGTLLTLVAAPSLPQDYLNATRTLPILAGMGSCGSAAVFGHTVVAEDITTHPDWSKARKLIREHGLKACWSVPVFSGAGEILGTLGIYYRERRTPQAGEMARVESAAKLVGLAIERGRAADKLREDETLLRMAGQTARLGGWTVDLPLNRIRWSDEVCAIHDMPAGYSPRMDEGLGFYLPASREVISEAFQRCAENGIPFDEELELLTARHRHIWVRAIGEAVRNESGVVTRIQGAFQDLTARKQAEDERRRIQDRLTLTLESITDAFFTLNQERRFTYLNREAERLLRRTREDLLGKVVWDEFMRPDPSALERAFSTGRAVVVEEYYEPLQAWLEVRAFPTEEGLAVYFKDITHLRQSRDQLKLLGACVSRITDMVIITEAYPLDEPGPRILFVNDAFTERTGYTKAEALGRSPRFMQGQKTQRAELDRIRLALTKGERVRTELLNYKKNGEEIWVETDIVPVKADDGQPAYFVAVQRDVTERKAAEDEARATEERYVRQRNSLIALTGIQPLETDDQAAAFRQITEAHARALGASRTSIWRYNSDRTAIHCEDLYELEAHRHSSGMELQAVDFPAYFEALEEMDVIAADNAHADPRTRAFSEVYFKPRGILSTMDAPIHLSGRIEGVMCSAQTGSRRQWTGDEKTFAASVANLVSLALEGGVRRQAEAALREIQQRFEIVAGATNDAVWDWDLRTDEIWWSEGFEKLFGHPWDRVGKSIVSWTSRIHPDDITRVLTGIRRTIAGPEDRWSEEYRFRRADGNYSHVLDRGFVMRDAAGVGMRMVGGMSDLTARKQTELDLARLNRALKMLSACNEAGIRAADETELLKEICRVAVETGGYRMAWVGYARHDAARSIEPMAFAGTEDGYLGNIQLTWDETCRTGQGPAGRTIRGGEAIVCRDVEEEAAFFASIEEARARDYRGVICLPLREGEKIFGLLGLYSSEILTVGTDEIKLLQELADDLAFGIGTLRARKERQRTEEVVLKVAQAVSSGTGTEFFDLLTCNMVEALGAHGGLIGRLNAADLEITTLSFVLEGKVEENVTYSLRGTPCENISAGSACIFDRGVQDLFPEDHLLGVYGIESYAGIPLSHRDGTVAGIMVIFFARPLEETSLVQSTLQIFATRAAAELDREQADERIREQASLLDRARDAILVRDLDHKINYWNKSAERLYGWTAEEAMGRSVEELLYRDSAAYLEAYKTVVSAGEWVGELLQVDREGRELMIEGRWTLLRDAADQPRNILAINTDITEHKKLEQQFLRAQRLESIGTLAGGIAHDLNNVLAPISMSIELLKADVHGERGQELLATLASSARRGAEMVSQVLSFARGMEGRRVELHARHLVGDVEKIVRDTFPKNITLRANIPRSLWTLQGDPTQLHQVLLNLCVNARDAMPDGGEITVTAENVELDQRFAASEESVKPGPHVLIRVEDSGHGIPSAVLDKIFEPFFTTKAVGKGTGLGLSTSLAIIRSHGGFIRAASTPGRGTCFLIVLPALPVVVDTIPEPRDEGLPRGNGETILVADDEPSIRQITRQILETFGYRVLLAANGAEAVKIYRGKQGEIAAVVTDMMMPVMDGSSTIQALAEINPAVRIIAASGISDKGKLATEAGNCVRFFVTKPFTAETLLKTLKIIVSTDS